MKQRLLRSKYIVMTSPMQARHINSEELMKNEIAIKSTPPIIG